MEVDLYINQKRLHKQLQSRRSPVLLHAPKTEQAGTSLKLMSVPPQVHDLDLQGI